MEQFGEFVVNNWELFLALVVIVALLLKDVVGGKLQGIKAVGPAEATGLINHQDAVVLDIRDEGEFAQGHILNSIHVPSASLKDPPKILEKYKDKPIIVGCRSGSRSAAAGRQLRKQGFATVYNLSGGILAWQNANLPMSKNK